jgi:hypothetical protein
MESKYLIFYSLTKAKVNRSAITLPDNAPHVSYAEAPLLPRIGEMVNFQGSSLSWNPPRGRVIDVIHELHLSQGGCVQHVIEVCLTDDISHQE